MPDMIVASLGHGVGHPVGPARAGEAAVQRWSSRGGQRIMDHDDGDPPGALAGLEPTGGWSRPLAV
jgi:hypothetical protein